MFVTAARISLPVMAGEPVAGEVGALPVTVTGKENCVALIHVIVFVPLYCVCSAPAMVTLWPFVYP